MKRHRAHRRHHHLRDAVAAADLERRVAVIDEDHLDLAAIVGIDRARRIEHRHAVLGREPRTRPDLRLVALGQRDGEAGGTIARAPGAIVTPRQTPSAAGRSTPAAPASAAAAAQAPAVIEPAQRMPIRSGHRVILS